MTNPGRLSDLLMEAADTLVGGFDLVDFLHHVAARAADITDSSAVGLMLADSHGRMHLVAASSEDPQLLDLFSVQHVESPCLDAHRTGEELADVDLRGAAERWPAFTARAEALGFTGAHCFPLRLREQRVGAMHVLRSGDRHLSAEERRAARALADVATIALVQERAARRPSEVTEQLLFALNSRIVVEQAKGTVALNLDLGLDEAFDLLRLRARQHHTHLTDLAHAVVLDRRALDSLVAEPPSSTG